MANNISQRIRNGYSGFSKGQKKIASAVLNEYEKVAYMTAARLGTMVGVSESTVVRFANELGYEGYTDFQYAVQELVRSKLTPNQRIEITKQRFGRKDILESVMEADMAKIRYTLETVDRNAFDKTIDAIIKARTVYILGARSALALAYFLQHNLSMIMDNIRLIQPMSTGEVFEQLYSVGEEDVVIAFSFPRYSTKMIRAVQYAKTKNATIVIVTDSVASPLAEHATYLLAAQSDMVSFADSYVAPLSIVNAIIAGIADRKQNAIEDRFNRLEKIWSDFDIYAKR